MNVYEIVTSRILDMLRKGVVPWIRPWSTVGMPMNLVSRKPYRGVNILLLSHSPYQSPYWATFNQIRALGGSIHAGEKSRIVVFSSSREREDEDGETVRHYFLRYYHLWNTDQSTLEVDLPEPVHLSDDEKRDDVEALLTEYAPPQGPRIICEDANQAYYRKSADIINMPNRSQFHSMEGYYQTLFHELIHSTGHETRLARKELASYFGGRDYSKEELTAEMGAAFLAASLGLDKEIKQSAAYIDGWLQTLGKNPLCVIQAASAAQRAVEFIQNQVQERKEDAEGAIAA